MSKRPITALMAALALLAVAPAASFAQSPTPTATAAQDDGTAADPPADASKEVKAVYTDYSRDGVIDVCDHTREVLHPRLSKTARRDHMQRELLLEQRELHRQRRDLGAEVLAQGEQRAEHRDAHLLARLGLHVVDQALRDARPFELHALHQLHRPQHGLVEVLLLRAAYLIDAVSYNRVRGKPFRIQEIVDEADRILGGEATE